MTDIDLTMEHASFWAVENVIGELLPMLTRSWNGDLTVRVGLSADGPMLVADAFTAELRLYHPFTDDEGSGYFALLSFGSSQIARYGKEPPPFHQNLGGYHAYPAVIRWTRPGEPDSWSHGGQPYVVMGYIPGDATRHFMAMTFAMRQTGPPS